MPEHLLMVDPSGESGFVEMKNVPTAFSQGYQRGYRLRQPNGKIIVAPQDLVNAYLKAGFSIVPDKVPSENSEA